MKKVDQKLESVYSYICDFVQENSYPPTIREIARGLNITSTSLVYSYIDKLTKQGRLEKKDNKNRALGIIGARPNGSIPLVGTVSAGTGILAIENIQDYYNLPEQVFNGNDLFLLTVCGESMVEAGISDGDLAVISKQEDVVDGEIALVLFDDRATIKRLYRKHDQLILHPENSTMQDIVLASTSELRILGKVVGCIKKF